MYMQIKFLSQSQSTFSNESVYIERKQLKAMLQLNCESLINSEQVMI